MAVPRPNIPLEKVIPLASKLFSFQSSKTSVVKELESYEDRNFLIKGEILPKADKQAEQATSEKTYVLKVLNPVVSRNIDSLILTSKTLSFLNAKGIKCPVPQPSISGKYIVWCRFPKTEERGKVEKWTHKEEILDDTELDSLRSIRSRYCDDNKTVVYAIQLFTFLPGKLLDGVKFNPDFMYNFGIEIGKLHKALKVRNYK